MEKEALTVNELADVLSIGRDKAYCLVKRADFPSIKLGASYIVPVRALRIWLLKSASDKLEINIGG